MEKESLRNPLQVPSPLSAVLVFSFFSKAVGIWEFMFSAITAHQSERCSHFFQGKTGTSKERQLELAVVVFSEKLKQRGMYTTEIEIYFKKLAHMTVEADKSDTCRAGQQAGDQGRAGSCSSSPQRPFGDRTPFCFGELTFFS